jgi:hypothetical protein
LPELFRGTGKYPSSAREGVPFNPEVGEGIARVSGAPHPALRATFPVPGMR